MGGRTIHKCVKKDLRTLTKPSNLIELARLNVSKITVRNNDVRATHSIDLLSPSAAAALTEFDSTRAVYLVSGFERTSCVRHETSKPVWKGGVAAREL